jgi:hypothetical protein
LRLKSEIRVENNIGRTQFRFVREKCVDCAHRALPYHTFVCMKNHASKKSGRKILPKNLTEKICMTGNCTCVMPTTVFIAVVRNLARVLTKACGRAREKDATKRRERDEHKQLRELIAQWRRHEKREREKQNPGEDGARQGGSRRTNGEA